MKANKKIIGLCAAMASFCSIRGFGASDGVQGLTKTQVGAAIHKNMSSVKYCQEAALQRNSSVDGTVRIHFSIGRDGAVTQAIIKSTTTNNPGLDDCILKKMEKIEFPKPVGASVEVDYPFTFKTKKSQ